ncbi:unnamed protein product [Rotaria socialis]
MDIGGYFAPYLAELGNKDSYPRLWKLLGIVEDTENGHQKYHDAKQSLPRNVTHPRIYSVARSQMKMTEDYNVGKSLVRAADTILRQTLDLRLEDHPVVGVIGFGKIGNSIAIHMRQQHIGRVMILSKFTMNQDNEYDDVGVNDDAGNDDDDDDVTMEHSKLSYIT